MFFSIECQSLRYSSKHCSQTRLVCFYQFRSRCQVCPELFPLYLCNPILGLFYQIAPTYSVEIDQAWVIVKQESCNCEKRTFVQIRVISAWLTDYSNIEEMQSVYTKSILFAFPRLQNHLCPIL